MGLIAVDTNLLIYAVHAASARHRTAHRILERLAEGRESWALPWPCVYEFLRVVTNPAAFKQPWSPEQALAEMGKILAAPRLHLLSETSAHPQTIERVVRQAQCRGSLMHDAHIWALCLEHGVSELWSGDHDFHRFDGLRLHNPFQPNT